MEAKTAPGLANGARIAILKTLMTLSQANLFEAPAPPKPEGLRYRADLIAPNQEQALVDELAGLPVTPFEFHGHLGNRRVAWFGWRYDYGGGGLNRAEPIPGYLLSLREAVADFAGRPREDFEQVLVTEYRPGAGIGWHRDKAQFGEIAGVSLLAPCTLRFRRKTELGKWSRLAVPIAPRSAYLLSGPARSEWEHSITPMETLRYSVTFRTLSDRAQAGRSK